MKQTLLFFLGSVLLFAACKKSDGSGSTSTSTFTATVNGTATTFKISQATLLRSTAANEKRMDILGTSTDNKSRLIITLGLETSEGSGMTVKSYVLNPFPEDDPSTPDVDESIPQGFTTYSTYLGNNNWYTDTYDEQGLFTITSCDSAHTTVSGTFATTLTDNNGSTPISISITDGKMDNVKYTVVN